MHSFTAETKEERVAVAGPMVLVQFHQQLLQHNQKVESRGQEQSVLALLGRVISTGRLAVQCVQMHLNSMRLTQKHSTAPKQFCGTNTAVTLHYCFKNSQLFLVNNTNKLKSLPLSSTSISLPRKRWKKKQELCSVFQ